MCVCVCVCVMTVYNNVSMYGYTYMTDILIYVNRMCITS